MAGREGLVDTAVKTSRSGAALAMGSWTGPRFSETWLDFGFQLVALENRLPAALFGEAPGIPQGWKAQN